MKKKIKQLYEILGKDHLAPDNFPTLQKKDEV